MSRFQDLLSLRSVRIIVALAGVALIAASVLIANQIGGSLGRENDAGPSVVIPTSGRAGNNPRSNPSTPGGGSSKGDSKGSGKGRNTNPSGGSSSGGGNDFGPINADLVAYLGCSQTTGSVEGYYMVGGQHFWPIIEWGGGSVTRWAENGNDDRYWPQFERNMDAKPASIIWWQLCVISGGFEQNYSDAKVVLGELRERIPSGSTIYVSAQNGYSAGASCGLSSPQDIQTAQDVADRLVSSDGLRHGPVMSDLAANETQGGCHPNDAGRRKFGHDLLDFFG